MHMNWQGKPYTQTHTHTHVQVEHLPLVPSPPPPQTAMNSEFGQRGYLHGTVAAQTQKSINAL